MSNRKEEADNLEVGAVFEPTRIAKQMLEQAYELVLPTQIYHRHLGSATNQGSHPDKAEQIICDEEEVA